MTRKRNLVIIPAWVALFVGAYRYRVDRENRANVAEMQALQVIHLKCNSPSSPFRGDELLPATMIGAGVYCDGWRYLPPEK